MNFQLEGSFSEKPLYRVLKDIVDNKVTGILSLSGESDTIVLTFELGMCVNAESYYSQPEYKLGHLMVLRGWITEKQLEELLSKQKQSMKKLGYIAREEKLVTVNQIMEVLEDQMLLIVFSSLTWKRGLFHIQIKDDVIYDKDSFRPVDLSEYIPLGEEILRKWNWVKERLPDFSVTPQLIPGKQVVPLGVQIKDKGEDSPVVLTKYQERVYNLINSIFSIQDIIYSCHQFPWYSILAIIELEDAGIVEIPQLKTKKSFAFENIGSYFKTKQNLKTIFQLGFVIVIACLVILLIPVVAFPKVPEQGKLWFQKLESRKKMDEIRFALNVYLIINKQYPQYLSELNEMEYLNMDDIKDAWGRKFYYKSSRSGYSLISGGKDGNWATEDDIIMEGEIDESFNGCFFSYWMHKE